MTTGQPPFGFSLPSPSVPAHDSWVTVEGGGLPQPLEVKVRIVGGAARIVGLKLDNGYEVTSSDLRGVRLGQIAEQLLAFIQDEIAFLADGNAAGQRLLDEWGVTEQDKDSFVRRRDGVLAGVVRSSPAEDMFWQMTDDGALHMQLVDWLERLREEDAEETSTLSRGRGAKPPTEAELRTFARTYLEEVTTKLRGSKVRTADRLGMDRGTVYRWIKLCEERGILPRRGEEL